MAIQNQINSRFVFGGCEENACGLNNLCVNLQHHQSKPQQHPEFKAPKIIEDRNSISQIISAQFDNQRIEIDHYINSQNERLRMALQEQRRQQTTALMKKYESIIQFLIHQKEDEISKAANRNLELQDSVRKMEMERGAWQRVAQEKEAMAASLNTTMIHRLRESAGDSGAAAVDAESCCCVEREGETWERETRKMVCRCCNSRKSCVVILPCRHLCSCRDCDALLDYCPLCNVAKKASLEALL